MRMALREMNAMVQNGMSEDDFTKTRDFLRSYSKLYVEGMAKKLGYAMDARFYGRTDWIAEMDTLLSKLTRDQIAILRAWIDQGLKWDLAAAQQDYITPLKLQPVALPDIPGETSTNLIDRFIAAGGLTRSELTAVVGPYGSELAQVFPELSEQVGPFPPSPPLPPEEQRKAEELLAQMRSSLSNEDRLIAHSFERYLATGDPEWPLLLPMVKSVVRALDASSEAAAQQWGAPLERFTVTGGSKRGWTTWLTAAVEPRVTAIAPIVIDALNMRQHFPHQTEVWGAPSEAIRPYTDLKLTDILGSDAGESLRAIVDQMAALALTVADRGYVLEQGRVVARGTAAELSADKGLEAAYLGAA